MQKFGALLALLVIGCSTPIEIPNIEQWQEITVSENDNVHKENKGHFIRWFKDPRGKGRQGLIVYYQPQEGGHPNDFESVEFYQRARLR